MSMQTQAFKFLEKHKTKIKTKFVASDKHFTGDDEARDIYEVTIERDGRKPYVFRFGQSIINSSGYVELCAAQRRARGESASSVRKYQEQAHRPPTDYDILAAITKHDPGTFEEFCDEFCYDTDSRKALANYLGVQKEFSEVRRIFCDVIEELAEIN